MAFVITALKKYTPILFRSIGVYEYVFIQD